MNLLTSFEFLLQELAVVMTQPSFQNFVTIVTGWVFARRRTVTGILVAAGMAGQRHHSAFHRFFAEGAWSLDALGLAVFRVLEALLPDHEILLAIDDTLARKRGLKVFGVGMHHDPLLSSRGKAITNWGHSWVVLGVIVQFPLWPKRAFCLPILFRLYLNHQAAERARRTGIGLIEPPLLPSWAYLAWGDRPAPWKRIGGGFILVGLANRYDEPFRRQNVPSS